jgi:class I fructose-bisphosphate aldolase
MEQKIPRETLTERVRHVVQSTFNGRRIIIFSGGEKTDDAAILDEARAIRAGGGFGSIIGRNSFQRDRTAALSLLDHMVRIYKGEML